MTTLKTTVPIVEADMRPTLEYEIIRLAVDAAELGFMFTGDGSIESKDNNIIMCFDFACGEEHIDSMIPRMKAWLIDNYKL